MEGLSIQPSISINSNSDFGLIVPLFSHPRRFCTLRFPPRTKKFVVFASKDEPRLNEWDQMELKFGKMLGEDPKLTLAKILGKKLNPDMSNLEIEKLFQKNKGKMDYDIKEVPFDVPKRRQASNKLDGLNLVRPVPKKGVKFEVDNKPKVSSVKRPTLPVAKPVNSTKDRVPDVALRKPSVFKEDDAEYTKPLTSRSLFNMSSNLGKGKENDRFSDIALIRKPEPISFDQDKEQESSGSIVEQNSTNSVSESSKLNDLTIVEKPERLKPEPISLDQDNKQESSSNIVEQNSMENVSETSKLNDLAIVEKPERLKPEPISLDQDNKQESSSTIVEQNSMKNVSESSQLNDLAIVEKPERLNFDIEKETPEDYNGLSSVNELSGATVRASKMNSSDQSLDCEGVSPLSNNEKQYETLTELQPLQQSDLTSDVKSSPAETSEIKSADSNTSPKVVLHKPARLSPPMKGTSNATGGEKTLVNPESSDSAIELEKLFTPPPMKEIEDIDWSRAEDLVKTGAREEVEVISSSTRGFVVSFGSIVGFLPYRNLAAKHKFLAFESWLRKRGLDPSVYKQTLSIIGSHELATKVTTPNSSLDVGPELKVDEQIPSSNKIEDLLKIYDQEKLKFLASFVGQKFKVNVILAERKSRRLILSVKPKEKEELVEKKRKLMAKLSIGDVVKCCIKKITYFGIFVEVEGVPALIHQTEVSWDATLDPASYFKNGQIVEAKVHQIDFSAERIFLSLKDIVPDPVTEAMEVVVGNHESLGGKLAAAEADTEWADVESLVKELQQFEGIQSVSRGRFFLSPGLAPTFQVYMASVLENQYKLLARAENRVQEVIVETSLGKEEMKSAILACTNRVK